MCHLMIHVSRNVTRSNIPRPELSTKISRGFLDQLFRTPRGCCWSVCLPKLSPGLPLSHGPPSNAASPDDERLTNGNGGLRKLLFGFGKKTIEKTSKIIVVSLLPFVFETNLQTIIIMISTTNSVVGSQGDGSLRVMCVRIEFPNSCCKTLATAETLRNIHNNAHVTFGRCQKFLHHCFGGVVPSCTDDQPRLVAWMGVYKGAQFCTISKQLQEQSKNML